MSGFEWVDSDDLEDDAEIITQTHKSGWSDRLQSARNGDSETVYDPIVPEERWLTVPDSMWVEVEE